MFCKVSLCLGKSFRLTWLNSSLLCITKCVRRPTWMSRLTYLYDLPSGILLGQILRSVPSPERTPTHVHFTLISVGCEYKV
jgi:hypothetical protein